MNRGVPVVLAAALLAAGRLLADTNAPAAAPATPAPAASTTHDAASMVSQALGLMASRGLQADPAVARAAALDAVVHAADPGGCVMSADDLRAWDRARRGLRRGIGVELAASNGQTRIVAVMPDSPASKVLRAGDLLDEVDGRYVTGFPLAQQIAWIVGATGSSVRISAVRSGQKDPVKAAIDLADLATPAVASVEVLPRGIGLVRLAGVWSGAAAEVRRVLAPWRTNGCPGVILDLREAGGGDADEAAALAALTSDPGATLFTLADRAGGKKDYRAPKDGVAPPWPVMLLVGPHTTGAAEALAAAAKAAGRRTLLIGDRTAGDPLIRETIAFEGGRALYVATLRLTAGASTAVEGPLEPQIRVEAVAAAPAARNAEKELPMNPRRKSLALEKDDETLRGRIGSDTALERAVDILLALQAMDSDTREPAAAPAP